MKTQEEKQFEALVNIENKFQKVINEIKKAKDRLNWAGKTSTGLGIQIQALIEMIAYSNNPDVIKEQRQVMANEMIKKMEAQIKAGETPEGMTITKQNDILDT